MSADIQDLSARRNSVRVIAACFALLSLGACASGARTGAMTVPVSPDQIIADNSPLKDAITVGTIEGGDKTNPLLKSQVSNEDFKAALENSLSLSAMRANAGGGTYVLNARLLGLKQPDFGLDVKVTSTVEYKMLAKDKAEPAFSDIVITPYTAKFSDAFVGVERLRLANEGAMRENIKEFMARIIKAAAPGGKLSGSPAPKISMVR